MEEESEREEKDEKGIKEEEEGKEGAQFSGNPMYPQIFSMFRGNEFGSEARGKHAAEIRW